MIRSLAMTLKTLALAATLLTAGNGLASATVVTGTFTGSFSSGTDDTGVFTRPGTDLTGAILTGTLAYDTDQLTTGTNGTVTSGASAQVPLSLRFSLTAFGHTYAFTSDTNANVAVDTAISEITLVANNAEAPGPIVFANSFSLDAYDTTIAFITGATLAQAFTASPSSTSGVFAISQYNIDTNTLTSGAGGTFTVSSLSLSTSSDVPEPMSLALLGTGLAMAVYNHRLAVRHRRTRN
jgi:hypothetical protein